MEQFFAAYEHTFQALSALGTFAAVLVALFTVWITHRRNRARIHAHATIMTIFHDSIDRNNRPLLLSVSVTNVGQLPVRISFSFFGWYPYFSKYIGQVSPMDWFPNQFFAPGMPMPQKQYPVTIPPLHSESFYLGHKSDLLTAIGTVKRDLKWCRWLRSRYMRAVVTTDDGTRVNVKLGKDILRLWRETAAAATEKK